MLTGKEDSPLVVELLLKAASTYSELEDNEKAIKLYNRAIAIIQRTLGPEHESLAVPLTNLAYLVLEEGGVEESELAMLRFCTTIPDLFCKFFCPLLSL